MGYKSSYSDREVTAPQYIVELLCANNAKSNNKELPMYFWNDPIWKGFYFVGLKHANRLLETYDERFLVDFIKKKNVWSLSAKWVADQMSLDYPKFLGRQQILAEQISQQAPQEIIITNPTFKQQQDIDVDFLD